MGTHTAYPGRPCSPFKKIFSPQEQNCWCGLRLLCMGLQNQPRVRTGLRQWGRRLSLSLQRSFSIQTCPIVTAPQSSCNFCPVFIASLRSSSQNHSQYLGLSCFFFCILHSGPLILDNGKMGSEISANAYERRF